MVRITEKRPSSTQLSAGSRPVGSEVMSWTDLWRRKCGGRVACWCSDSDSANQQHFHFVTVIKDKRLYLLAVSSFMYLGVICTWKTTVRSETWPPPPREKMNPDNLNFLDMLLLAPKLNQPHWSTGAAIESVGGGEVLLLCSWTHKVNLWLTIQNNSKTKTGRRWVFNIRMNWAPKSILL